jgi:hypothetical protein
MTERWLVKLRNDNHGRRQLFVSLAECISRVQIIHHLLSNLNPLISVGV